MTTAVSDPAMRALLGMIPPAGSIDLPGEHPLAGLRERFGRNAVGELLERGLVQLGGWNKLPPVASILFTDQFRADMQAGRLYLNGGRHPRYGHPVERPASPDTAIISPEGWFLLLEQGRKTGMKCIQENSTANGLQEPTTPPPDLVAEALGLTILMQSYREKDETGVSGKIGESHI